VCLERALVPEQPGERFQSCFDPHALYRCHPAGNQSRDLRRGPLVGSQLLNGG
jgi:hypothetical protein